jgi:HD-like signal output (HDOD) protein
MNSADVFAQIETMGELPSLPRTLLYIQNVASDERSSAEDLARVILEDQALTMRVLKVVNSALYQRREAERVRTVHRAVIVMGFETVRKLALGLSVFDMMSKLSRSPLLTDIARHSLLTAGLAQVLAEAAGTVSPEEAFVAGLVHDIGKVVLIECSPHAMDLVQRDVARGAGPLVAERHRFGITHDRAGRRLAMRWQLPEDLQNLIGDHHDIDPLAPPRRLEPPLAVLVYANAIARFGEMATGEVMNQRILHHAMRRLGIASARQEALLTSMEREVIDLAEHIGLEPGDLSAYRKVINVEGSASVAPPQLGPEELARRTAGLLGLYQEIGQGLAEGRDAAELLESILEGAVDILGFERVLLLRAERLARRILPWMHAGPGAAELAAALDLPLSRETGALALAVIEKRVIHAPSARSEAYGNLIGAQLLRIARCTGFAAAPVVTPAGVAGVLYADTGVEGSDVAAEQASELGGLAAQVGLVCGMATISSRSGPDLP